jgi:anti-anti-sigma factor
MVGLKIEPRREGEAAVVRVSGEARLEVAEPLRTEARALLAGGVRFLLFDVADLTFADSASLGLMLEIQREAEKKGGGFALFGARARLARTLDGTGLAARMKSSPDEATARKAIGA